MFFSSLIWRGADVSAQTYPVQLSTNIIPPYSGYLPDYADPSSEKLKVILQFNDFTVAQYNVRLKFEIKGNGFTLTTKQLYNPPPLQIEPGVPFLLSGADLAPYLNSSNLDFVGINQSQYEQRMALPEGYYTICVKAYDYYNNGGTVQVSNEACAQAWFTLSDPPFLNLPFCNASVTPQTPQNILFQWTPMNMGSPNSAFNTEYDFELWECRPDTNAIPNQIVLSTAPIFSITTQQTVLNYGIVEPALNLYMKYVWRVRARDISGRDLFKNQGYSQICTFNYGSVANVLGSALTLNLSAQGVTHRMGKCTWNTQSLFTSYKLQVRKQGTTNWFDYNTTQGSEKVTNLEPNTDYEAQVQGIGNGITSAWSNIATFRTNNEQNYSCNDQTQLADPLQAQPLPLNKAVISLIIQSGQFEIITTQIAPTGAPGWYSGKGYARVFGILPLAVQWSNIYIDDNSRHQQGVIQAMTKGIDSWVHQWDVTNAQNDPEVVNGTITSFTVNNGQYCYTLQGSTQQLCDTFPSGTNVFVVRDESGNEYTVNLVPPPPTVTGPTNYIVTSPDNMGACDSLMVTFEASQNQAFGFDAKLYTANIPNYECIKLINGDNYFVPYKSIGETQSDEIIANVQITNFNAAKLSFKTLGGAALTSTSIGNNKYKITGISASADCIYAWYNNKKIGKVNIVSLKPITKKVVIVPVNGASNSITAAQLNAIYKQANVAWTLTTASAFNFNLGNDGLEAADATLLAKYSAEMRALRDAYKQANSNYDKDAYYIFVVPNFSIAEIKGYMVRGRAIGFVTANATAKEVAHELAHGAFGLEHTFPKIDKETSNNLLDYGSGEKLTKMQWMDIRNPSVLPSWDDTEEDGSLLDKSCHYGLTPSGKPFDVFYSLQANVPPMKLNGAQVVRYINAADYCVPEIKYNNEIYKWDLSQETYTSSTGKSIKAEAETKTLNDRVNIFYSYNDGCNYASRTILWTSVDQTQSGNIQDRIKAKMDSTSKWKNGLYADTKSNKCGYGTVTTDPTCPPLPSNIQSLTVNYLVSHFFAYKSLTCFVSIPLNKRQELLKKMINSTFVTNCLQNVDTVTIGNCYEPLIYDLLSSTPPGDEKNMLDWLLSENLILKILDKTQFQTFDDITKKLVGWQLNYYPLSGSSAISGMLNNTLKRIEYFANNVSGSVSSSGIILTRNSYVPCEYCVLTPEKEITISNPLEYVVVHFKNDLLNFKAGDEVKMPAMMALYLFNKDRRDRDISRGKFLLDVGLFAIGVGEIEAAYTAYKTANGIYATYLTVKTLADISMSITDIIINNQLATSWQNTPEGQARLDRWNKINLYYALGSLSASAIDNALQKLGSNYHSLDDATEFDNIANELDGFTSSASTLVNSLNPQLRKIHNNLVSGGVQVFEQGNVIKYVTNNGNEFAKIENNVFFVTTSKGSIPLPSTYLDATYIINHINKFNIEGGAFIIRKSDLTNPNYTSLAPRKFIGLKSEMDAVILKYNNSGKNPQILIDELDLGNNYFNIPNDEVYFVTVEPNKGFSFDMPTGNEGGAYEGFWVPGGYTKHGTAEAVISNSADFQHNNNLQTFKSIFGINNVIKIN